MVLINLSKLMKFIRIIYQTPKEVSKRTNRLINQYFDLKEETKDVVSVKLMANLEGFRERHLDQEETEKKYKILEQLILDYTCSGLSVPNSDGMKKYLVPNQVNCLNPNCSEEQLVLCRPSRTTNSCPIFGIRGVVDGEIYRRICPSCQSIYYYNYYDSTDSNGQIIRMYYESKEDNFFSTTNETFFEKELLEHLTEDIVTCNVQFTNWTTAYNRLRSKDDYQISYKLVIPAWLFFSMWKRMVLRFPVVRDKARKLDIEAACAYFYPELRRRVDEKWLNHFCNDCSTRLVVMDGDAKAYRTVCSANTVKNIEKGKLNEFVSCAASPLPGKDKCLKHLETETIDAEERLDYGMMTRARRKELGISIDVLTTEEGCRKREAITQRAERSKTAGMLYCYRTCGVSLGHVECIHCETCTAFQLLLFELFGPRPDTETLTGVVIDRGKINKYSLIHLKSFLSM